MKTLIKLLLNKKHLNKEKQSHEGSEIDNKSKNEKILENFKPVLEKTISLADFSDFFNKELSFKDKVIEKAKNDNSN